MPTLTELTTPITSTEVETAIYNTIEAKGTQTSSWKSGAIVRTIIAACGILMNAFSTLQRNIACSGFLGLATGGWLAQLARDVYNTIKIDATFAAGDLTLDNGAGGVFSVAVGDSIVSNPTTGKTYRNTAAFTLAAFETGKLVPYQAIEAGTASNSAAGTITNFVTPLTGVTVTNVGALGASDDEQDEELRVRCKEKLGSLSPNGTKDAYNYVAKSAVTTGGLPTGVTRTGVIPNAGGVNQVYLATASGGLTGTIGDYSTPLGAADRDIQQQVVPIGITANVQAATSVSQPVTYEAWVRESATRTADEIKTQVDTALTAFMVAQPIGGSKKVAGSGFLFKDAIAGAIADAIGSTDLIDLAVTVPAADVTLLESEAPVGSAVTAVVNVVNL